MKKEGGAIPEKSFGAALVAAVAVVMRAVVCATFPQPWENAAMAAFLRNKKPGVCDLG